MPDDLPIRRGLTIPGAELRESVSRASGPGGQHVNKTSTRVTVRWCPAQSAVLGPVQRTRLLGRLAEQLTGSGELVVSNGSTRSQARNRERARERLAQRVREALVVQQARRKTRPSRASRERRLVSKQKRSAVKRSRGRVRSED